SLLQQQHRLAQLGKGVDLDRLQQGEQHRSMGRVGPVAGERTRRLEPFDGAGDISSVEPDLPRQGEGLDGTVAGECRIGPGEIAGTYPAQYDPALQVGKVVGGKGSAHAGQPTTCLI